MAGPNIQTPVYRGDTACIAALRAAPLLSNPHSRSVRAAPRFSPTRFIPPVVMSGSFPNLITSRLWG